MWIFVRLYWGVCMGESEKERNKGRKKRERLIVRVRMWVRPAGVMIIRPTGVSLQFHDCFSLFIFLSRYSFGTFLLLKSLLIWLYIFIGHAAWSPLFRNKTSRYYHNSRYHAIPRNERVQCYLYNGISHLWVRGIRLPIHWFLYRLFCNSFLCIYFIVLSV